MKYISIGAVLNEGTEHVLDVAHGGAKFRLTGEKAVFLVDQAIHVGVLYLIFRWGRLNTDISAYSVSVRVTFIVLLLILPCSILINKMMKDIFSDNVRVGRK